MENIKVLIFNLNGEKYATNIANVERILGYTEPTELPDSPHFVKGVITYQEKIIPIISMYSKFSFGLDNISEESKIIVVKKEEKNYGIIVDNVYEVKDVDNTTVEEAPTIATTISKRYIKGLIKYQKEIIILLDLGKVLSDDEESLIY